MAISPLVGGTVESHIKPITAPNMSALAGVTGNEMKASTASARIR